MYHFTEKSLAPLYKLLDATVALASLSVVLVSLHLMHIDLTSHSLLETRITVKNLLLVSGMALGWPVIFAAFGLYRLRELQTRAEEVVQIAKASAFGTVFPLGFALTSTSGLFTWRSVALFPVVALVATAATRAASRAGLRAIARLRRHRSHVLIVGTGPGAVQHYERLRTCAAYEFVGFIDTVPGAAAPEGEQAPPFLGTVDSLESLLATRAIDLVHIALPARSCYAAIEKVIATCERVGVESSYPTDLFRRSLARPHVDPAGQVVALKVVTDDNRLWAKRAFDVVGATLGLVVLSPLMLAAAIAIKLTSPGPVFFRQERYGYNRRRFRMWKFRTMVIDAEARQRDLERLNEADGPIFKIRRDPRITPVGRFLRKTSIDELPQLLNVLTGEMSLVGPRPMAVRDVSRFSEAALLRRFSVRPGLTCLWQVNGRSNLRFDRWMALDLEYIDRWSLALDFHILARTVPAVLRREGAV
jgi:exopolysaccharide biosynthesis polyprenyl glycosylphosphotransferase